MNVTKTVWSADIAWTAQDAQARCQRVQLVAATPRAVKLIAPEQIPLHHACTISILDATGEVQQAVPAAVHLLRYGDDGNHISCRLNEPLSETLLERLRQDGLYERRDKGRQRVTLDAPAWPELNSNSQPLPVRVIDLSRGGCCIKSPAPMAVGNRLTIFAGDKQGAGEVVRLRVMWQQPSDDEFLLGCAFLQEADSAVLATLAQPPAGGSGRLLDTVRSVGQFPVSVVLSALHSEA